MIFDHTQERLQELLPRGGPLLFYALLALSAGFLGTQVFAQQSTTESTQSRSHHYFTVRDSIGLSRFDATDGRPLFSPDHEFFSVVTSRGVIETDSIESTLWIFRASEARHLLDLNESSRALHGKAVFRLARVPRNNYTIPYAPVISNVRWSQDSRALLFLGQDGCGERRLYRVDTRSRSAHEITHKGEDVSLYEVRGRTIVYLVVRAKQNVRIGRPINADALDITGEPLAMFMPQVDETALYRELWVLRDGRRWRLHRDGKYPIRLANHFPEVLAISPDERSVAVLLPSNTVPAVWESYQTENGYARLHPNDPGIVEPFNFIRPMQYAVFDLGTGETRFILNAPQAYALGYIQQNSAIWAGDSRSLLMTNTFLPINQSSDGELQRSLAPCACSIFNFDLKSTNCIAWSRYKRANGYSLASASFGLNADEVILGFNTPSGEALEERYVRKGRVWECATIHGNEKVRIPKAINSRGDGDNPLTIEISETPNQPPVLVAEDMKSGRSRKVWDPNPQLASFNLGEVYPFNWVDDTGYEWIGQLVEPPDYVSTQRYPLVIETHGFSRGFVSDGLFPTASSVRALAAAGMMVLQMPRRSDHYGTVQEAPDQLRGMQSAIERLTERGLVDPEKVGIIGFSHTCYYVESALVSDPKRFKAATIADGMDGSYVQYLYSVGTP